MSSQHHIASLSQLLLHVASVLAGACEQFCNVDRCHDIYVHV